MNSILIFVVLGVWAVLGLIFGMRMFTRVKNETPQWIVFSIITGPVGWIILIVSSLGDLPDYPHKLWNWMFNPPPDNPR